jgi:hypothetical protein
MILSAFNPEKYAKIGVVKMVFALMESAIAIQVTQEKIVPLQAALQINFITHQRHCVVRPVHQELTKIHIQELVFHALLHVVNVWELLMPVLLANLHKETFSIIITEIVIALVQATLILFLINVLIAMYQQTAKHAIQLQQIALVA